MAATPLDALKNLTSGAAACDRSDSEELALVLLVASLVFLGVAIGAVAWVVHAWDHWYSETASNYFILLDRDNDGRVSLDELYTGVLQLYVRVPMKIYPPQRKTVNKILLYLTSTNLITRSDSLDVEEFALVMAALSAQCLSRLIITFVYYLWCPIMGALLWTLAVDFLLSSGEVDVGAGVPRLVKCGGSVLDKLHLGPPLLTVLLMLPVKRVVRAGEKGLKGLALVSHRLLRATRWREAAADSSRGIGSDEARRAEEDEDEEEPSAKQLLERKRRIEGGIRRRSTATPLLRPHLSEHDREEDVEEEEEEAAIALARGLQRKTRRSAESEAWGM